MTVTYGHGEIIELNMNLRYISIEWVTLTDNFKLPVLSISEPRGGLYEYY